MSSFRTFRTTHSGTTAARRGAVALAATALGAAALASSVPAYAAGGQAGGGRAVRATSVCDAGLLKLKAKTDTGGILEVGAELDTNVNDQIWTLSIVDNGVTAWTGTRTTAAPSGAFGAAAVIPNLVGQDVLTFSAQLGTSTCTAKVTVL